MAKFIEIIDIQNEKRVVNVNCISDIYENILYMSVNDETGQIRINTSHSYEELVTKLQNAGAEVFYV